MWAGGYLLRDVVFVRAVVGAALVHRLWPVEIGRQVVCSAVLLHTLLCLLTRDAHAQVSPAFMPLLALLFLAILLTMQEIAR
eukprot:2789998-Pyramimonas_sp.AAC.2